jgi:hypothetical protein
MDDRTINHPLWGFEEPAQIEPVSTSELEEIETIWYEKNMAELEYLIAKAYVYADIANNFVAAYESGNCGRFETLVAVKDFEKLMDQIRKLIKE